MRNLLLALTLAFSVTVARAEDTPDYLSFTATGGDVEIGMKWSYGNPTATHIFEWSVDKVDWTEFLTGSSNMTVRAGKTVYFRRKGEAVMTLNPGGTGDGWMFTMTAAAGATITAGGNVMSLLDATCQQTAVGTNAFRYLFVYCNVLTAAPALPAMVLAEWCYASMFSGCTALTAAPALPATELAENCYCGMFERCTALMEASGLPAMKLEVSCYERMFNNCTALTAAPALPATELAENCYSGMFRGCTALTAAPALPATELAKNCYGAMFSDCTALTAAPALPATELAEVCYPSMFFGCTALDWVKVGFTKWDTLSQTMGWLNDVASDGLFVCPSELPDQTGFGYIPQGWTKVDAATARFVWVPKVAHLNTTVTTNGNAVAAYAGSTCWMVEAGASVQIEFADDRGYELKGTAFYSIESLTDDITFGTTAGYPLPEVKAAPPSHVMFHKGDGVEKIEFKCSGGDAFIEFPSEGTNLVAGTVIELKVMPRKDYRYTGATQFTVPDTGLDKTIIATEIAWGGKDRPWGAGDDVTAYTNGIGGLVITGSGAMSDFASAAEVPWAAVADQVTAVTVDEGVTKIGKNALAGFGDTVTVNGTPLSTYRTVSLVEAKINGMSLADYNAAVRFFNVGSEWQANLTPVPVPPVGAVATWDALTNAIVTAESGAEIAVGADITEESGELVVPKGKAVTIKLYGKTVSCGLVTVGGALMVGDAEDAVGKIVATEGAKVVSSGSVTLLGGPMRGTFTARSPGLVMLFH